MENNINLTNKQKAFAIFKWTIRKYLPMSVAYWILLFISFPMVEVFGMIVCFSQDDFEEYITSMKDIAQYLPGSVFSGIVILFSVILTIIAFSYMHNKRCVDFFGSFPVSRRTLFFARFFAVLVMCIVPLIVFGLIGALLTFNDFAMIEAFKVMGYLILGVAGNVSFIAFISVCCGTVADVLISYCVINAVYPICVAICYFFPVSVIPGLQGGYIGEAVFTLFSPAAAPFVGMFGTSKSFHIVWWALFTLVLVAGCFVLCRKRKAETAQNAFAFATVEIVIKFVTCFAAGFGVGWIFANIGAAYGTIQAEYVWFFIGMFMGILVVDFLLHLIFHRGLAKFSRSFIECSVVAVATTVFLFVITTGAFGYDERIPNADEVEQVSLITEGNKFADKGENLLETYKDDQQTIYDFIELHKNLLENYKKEKERVYPIVEIPNDSTYEYSEDAYSYLELNYQLKNGKKISRVYSNHRLNDVKMPNKLDKKFSLTEEEILNQMPEKYVSGISIYLDFMEFDIYSDVDEKEVKSLLKALKKDISEQGISNKSGKDDFYIDICYEDSSYTYSKNCGFYIPDTYVNTIQVIKENRLYYSEYRWLENQVYAEVEPEEAEKILKNQPARTIYFKVPDSWNKDAEIKCMLFNEEWNCFYTALDSNFANCEKVSDDVWKYEIPDVTDGTTYQTEAAEGFTSVMFYQPSEEEFHFSGRIDLNGAGNMLVLGNKKKNRNVSDYYKAQYAYEWTTYHE